MLSSSRAKIHKPHITGVSPRPTDQRGARKLRNTSGDGGNGSARVGVGEKWMWRERQHAKADDNEPQRSRRSREGLEAIRATVSAAALAPWTAFVAATRFIKPSARSTPWDDQRRCAPTTAAITTPSAPG